MIIFIFSRGRRIMLRFQYICVILACSFVSHVWANGLEVRDAWIREAPPVAQSHAAYMELANNSDKAVEIISIWADDYAMTMLHKSVIKNGMATMEHVDSLTIPPQGVVKLEPGGFHIMLMNPKRKLKAGDTVKITICFTRDRHQEISVTVRAAP